MSHEIPRMPAVGDVLLERYRLEAIIGEGGMGLVYCARQLPSDRRVAIKVLSNGALARPESLPRFVNEARATMQLQSPHVVKVIDVGTLDDIRPFVIMELLEGADLGRLIERRKHLPIAEAVDYVIQAADAIADAHKNGIVHRDLKPSNLFLTSKTHAGGKSNIIKVLDFGISKLSGDVATSHALTATGALLGTPQYMSPEQLKNAEDVDGRADIWSLGVILYQLITGRPPFDSEHAAVFALVLTADFKPLGEVRGNVPVGVSRAVSRCLRKAREERFPDLVELVRALAPFASPDGARTAMRIQRMASGLPVADGPPAPEAPASGAAVRSKLAGAALMAELPPLPGAVPQSTPAMTFLPPFNPHALPPLPVPPSQQQIETMPSSNRIALAQVQSAALPQLPQSPGVRHVAAGQAPAADGRPRTPNPMAVVGVAVGLAVSILGILVFSVVRMGGAGDLPSTTSTSSASASSASASSTPASSAAASQAPTHSPSRVSPPLPASTRAASSRDPSPAGHAPRELPRDPAPASSAPLPAPVSSAARATTGATSSILDLRK